MSAEIAGEGPTCADDLGRFEKRWRTGVHADDALSVVCLGEAAYPVNLAEIEGAPPCLFVRGTLLPGDSCAVSVVGNRRASVAGVRLARTVAAELAEAGVTVVSGLARGIDAAAHTGALAAGGRTIAVLGSGLGCVYPPEHLNLASEVSGSGAVVSQWWPWSPPAPDQFRRRNAVSSGMSLATLVVEATARSGARLQGRLARQQGRVLLLAEALVRVEPWARALVEGGSALAVTGAGDVLDALRGPTLQDIRHWKVTILQSSAQHPTRPVQPGLSRQLRLDID